MVLVPRERRRGARGERGERGFGSRDKNVAGVRAREGALGVVEDLTPAVEVRRGARSCAATAASARARASSRGVVDLRFGPRARCARARVSAAGSRSAHSAGGSVAVVASGAGAVASSSSGREGSSGESARRKDARAPSPRRSRKGTRGRSSSSTASPTPDHP